MKNVHLNNLPLIKKSKLIEERKETRKDDCVRYDIGERQKRKKGKKSNSKAIETHFFARNKKTKWPTIPTNKENKLKLKEKRTIV